MRLHGISHIMKAIFDISYAKKYHLLLFFTEYYLDREYGIRISSSNGKCPFCGIIVENIMKHIIRSRRCWYALLKYVSEAYKVYLDVMRYVGRSKDREGREVYYCSVCRFRSEFKFIVLIHIYEEHVKPKLI